jgi:hypothetical protein
LIRTTPDNSVNRPIPLTIIILLALAVHGPLLLMQLPNGSYDAYTHMFFASHYAHHWFDAWNEKWFAGFSQATYPPLVHQLIGLLSHAFGLELAYMLVQLTAILLLPVGVYHYARIWIDERPASYAAIGSIFLGSLAMLTYQSGQLPNIFASVLVLNALPFIYRWLREASFASLLKGGALIIAAGAAHHVTALFGLVLFASPVLLLAIMERQSDEADASVAGVLTRTIVIGLIIVAGIAITLWPYWMALHANPIRQAPIPHASRDNYILNPQSGLNFWVMPYGALILAIPFIFWRGASSRRLFPLFLGWFVTTLIGLGGTTPAAHLLLQRAFDVLTFERFTYWSTLMALPFLGLLTFELIRRFNMKAVTGLAVAAVITFGAAVSWVVYHPISGSSFNSGPVIDFLNRDEHAKFRYITLGFGPEFSRVSTLAEASSVDGDYNSARLLPELTQYGAAKLDNAKYYGTNGMESLRAMLKHANLYGLKYIFVRDRYYEPLLAFAGWRPTESYENGSVTLWTKDDILPARKLTAGVRPTAMMNLMWGTLPMASLLLAITFVLALQEKQRKTPMEFPKTREQEPVYLREAK